MKVMLQPITLRTVKSYQQDNDKASVNLIQIEDEISATFELLKVLHHYNSQNFLSLSRIYIIQNRTTQINVVLLLTFTDLFEK